MDGFKNHFGADGKPLDQSYLECGIPEDLKASIREFVFEDSPSRRELLVYGLISDINSAERCDEISHACAQYLRHKYLRYDWFAEDWFTEVRRNG